MTYPPILNAPVVGRFFPGRKSHIVHLLLLTAITQPGCVASDDPSDDGTSPSGLSCEDGEVKPVETPQPPFFADVTAQYALDGFIWVLAFDANGDFRDDLLLWDTDLNYHLKTQLEGGGFGPPQPVPIPSTADFVIPGDLDNDGDQDLVAAGPEPGGVLLNDGAGNFAFATALDIQAQSSVLGVELADFNGDGNLDLYAGVFVLGDETQAGLDRLYLGIGDGTFVDNTDVLGDQLHPDAPWGTHLPAVDDLGRAAAGVAATDYDNDGDLDIFVNGFGAGRPIGCLAPYSLEKNLLWRNDGEGQFTDVGKELELDASVRGTRTSQTEDPLTSAAFGSCSQATRDLVDALAARQGHSPIGGNGFGARWIDFDNDADQDLIIGSVAHPDYPQSDRTLLYVNHQSEDGTATFSEESLMRGLVYREDDNYWTAVDLDNDGLVDLVSIGQGRHNTQGGAWLRIYLQREDHTFTMFQDPNTTGVPDTDQGQMVWTDMDGDGDQDLLLTSGSWSQVRVYENRIGHFRNAIELRLTGSADGSADARGARVSMDGPYGPQMREIMGNGGHFNPRLTDGLSFGLGDQDCARNVEIRWPNGESQTLDELPVNEVIVVRQGGDVSRL